MKLPAWNCQQFISISSVGHYSPIKLPFSTWSVTKKQRMLITNVPEMEALYHNSPRGLCFGCPGTGYCWRYCSLRLQETSLYQVHGVISLYQLGLCAAAFNGVFSRHQYNETAALCLCGCTCPDAWQMRVSAHRMVIVRLSADRDNMFSLNSLRCFIKWTNVSRSDKARDSPPAQYDDIWVENWSCSFLQANASSNKRVDFLPCLIKCLLFAGDWKCSLAGGGSFWSGTNLSENSSSIPWTQLHMLMATLLHQVIEHW